MRLLFHSHRTHREYIMQPLSNTPESGNARGLGLKAPIQTDAPQGEFRNFVADVEDLITETTSITGEGLVRVKAKLGERVAAAKESIQEMGGAVVQRARRTATVTNDYVHEQPWAAVGIGAAVGVLIGFALGRRK
jgi:ElaB/YqjD/DUF883 family membrane-anchored ribosome-binding protein